MLKTTLIVSIVLWLFIGTVDGRQGLRNYMVSHDYRQSLRRDDYSVYDETDNELICKIESGAENSSNRFISLVAVPSLLSIATIRTVVTPFMYQAYWNIFDDQLNRWMYGQIMQRFTPWGFMYSIEYGGQPYVMENKYGSPVVEIRSKQKPDNVLTRFYRRSMNPRARSSRYNVKIYSNDLPDPFYILALYAYDSNYINNQTKVNS